MNVGLTQTAASVYQMLRGAVIVITALFSVVFLRRKQYAHHLISILIIVAGVALVGWASTHYSEQDKDEDSGASTSLMGVAFVLMSQCFVATQFVVEENIFNGYYLDPLYCVGMEGFWGCCYCAILLPIFQHITCTADGICGMEGVVEDTKLAFQQLANHWQLMVMSIGIILTISLFNWTGQAITKYASAAQRSTVDTCRTLFIWII